MVMMMKNNFGTWKKTSWYRKNICSKRCWIWTRLQMSSENSFIIWDTIRVNGTWLFFFNKFLWNVKLYLKIYNVNSFHGQLGNMKICYKSIIYEKEIRLL